jgi:hypothetical protein
VLQSPKDRTTVFLLTHWLRISQWQMLGTGVHTCTLLDSSHTQDVQTMFLILMEI